MQTTTFPTEEKQETQHKKMQAAVLAAPGKFEFRETEISEPAADEVLIRIEGCGLCASNIPLWEGRDWFDYPIEPGAPGHEGYGTVEKVGEEVNNLQPGDRVAAISYKAFAEYDLAKAEHVVKLPNELKDMPFPGEPLGCAMNIFKRSDIQKGHKVAVVGAGFLGALLVQLAKAEGADVVAVSQRKFSLETAEKMGADKTVQIGDHKAVINEVKEWSSGNWCDRVIEATGAEYPVQLASEFTAVRGKLIIAGFHQGGMRSVNMQLWNWRGIDVINAHERDPKEYVKGIEAAVEAVLKGKMDPRPLFTHEFPKEEIEKGFEMLTNRPDGFIKGIVKF